MIIVVFYSYVAIFFLRELNELLGLMLIKSSDSKVQFSLVKSFPGKLLTNTINDRLKIGIDECIHLRGKKQMQILQFTPEWQKRFVPVGQRTLGDF